VVQDPAGAGNPPDPLVVALQEVERRLARRLARAESAYVRQARVRKTTNCRHHGSPVGDRVHGCRLHCLGANETEAGLCYPSKATVCPFFVPERSVAALREEFRRLSEDELRLRWPSLGELQWMRVLLQSQASRP
jgi:hypothetical protein